MQEYLHKYTGANVPEEPLPAPLPTLTCNYCQAEIRNESRFCPRCGTKLLHLSQESVARKSQFERRLLPILAYYILSVILLVAYYTVSSDEIGDYTSLMIFDGIFSLFTLGFVIANRDQMLSLFNPDKVRVPTLLSMAIVALLGAIGIHYLGDAVNIFFFGETYDTIGEFAYSDYPLLLATVFIAIQPALFEEMAFRGFLFNHLSALSNPQTAIIVSTLLFGFLHFSPISLLWLLPLGFLFASYRQKYDTIWYGIFGHFTYNFTLVLLSFYGF